MVSPKYQVPTKEELVQKHLVEKMSRVDLEKFYNVTGPVIIRWFKIHNIEFVGRKDRNRPPKQELEDLHYNKKMTIAEIALHYDKAQRYIDQWFNFYQIPVLRYRKKRKQKIDKNTLIEMHHHSEMTFKEIADFLGVSDVIVGQWCDQFQIEKRLHNRASPHSKAEQQIASFVESLGFHPIKTRSVLPARLELDVYIPEKKFAIEHCGLYWHNEERLSNSYHAIKTNFANGQEIELLTIFEDEWIEKRSIVESMIKSKLGLNSTIFARKCEVREVSTKQAKQFFKENHLQGAPNALTACFGLIYQDDLVGCMSFGQHPRKIMLDTIVLQRMAFKKGTNVVGGATKLFEHAKKQLKYNKIITWSDKRFSAGNVYNNMGFVRECELPPDYWYVKGQKRFPKQKFQKRFTGCPSAITEKQFARQQGYIRIWDCGKTRWYFECNKSE